jgi:hypothetical protein
MCSYQYDVCAYVYMVERSYMYEYLSFVLCYQGKKHYSGWCGSSTTQYPSVSRSLVVRRCCSMGRAADAFPRKGEPVWAPRDCAWMACLQHSEPNGRLCPTRGGLAGVSSPGDEAYMWVALDRDLGGGWSARAARTSLAALAIGNDCWDYCPPGWSLTAKFHTWTR